MASVVALGMNALYFLAALPIAFQIRQRSFKLRQVNAAVDTLKGESKTPLGSDSSAGSKSQEGLGDDESVSVYTPSTITFAVDKENEDEEFLRSRLRPSRTKIDKSIGMAEVPKVELTPLRNGNGQNPTRGLEVKLEPKEVSHMRRPLKATDTKERTATAAAGMSKLRPSKQASSSVEAKAKTKSTRGVAGDTAKKLTQVSMVKAKSSYKSTKPKRMSFARGDRIEVVSTKGMCMCVCIYVCVFL